MVSMRMLLLIAAVVNGLVAKNIPANVTEVVGIQQETSKRTAQVATDDETTRSKRQIPCCCGNPYPIITLPSCSIPYTIINGTCYLATCPKICNEMGPVKELNPRLTPVQRRDEDSPASKIRAKEDPASQSRDIDDPTSDQPIAQHQRMPSKRIDDGDLQAEPERDKGANNNTPLPEPLEKPTLPSLNNEEPTDSFKIGNPEVVIATDGQGKNTTITPSETLNSTSTNIGPIKEEQKHTAHIVSNPNATECEICQCFCTPVNCDCCIDVESGNDTKVLLSESELAHINPDSLSCRNYSPMCGCGCCLSTNPVMDTAGLMKGSGNGKGGNTIVSSMNILAGPSCEDPCSNQNACMLSNSGNGDGGNRVIANANFINGGNLLCCCGNGKGGNCIKSMINFIGGNSGNVLPCSELLKRLCDVMAFDETSSSDPTPDITTTTTTTTTTSTTPGPSIEPVTKPDDNSHNNSHDIAPTTDTPKTANASNADSDLLDSSPAEVPTTLTPTVNVSQDSSASLSQDSSSSLSQDSSSSLSQDSPSSLSQDPSSSLSQDSPSSLSQDPSSSLSQDSSSSLSQDFPSSLSQDSSASVSQNPSSSLSQDSPSSLSQGDLEGKDGPSPLNPADKPRPCLIPLRDFACGKMFNNRNYCCKRRNLPPKYILVPNNYGCC